MGRELTLKRALSESRREHDVILIDCPPALGLLTVNALVAATHALISSEGEYFSLQGVEQVLEVMELARENLNENLELARRRAEHRRPAHDPLARGARSAARELRRQGVRDRRSASRSATRSRPSAACRSSTTGPSWARDYIALADEVLDAARRRRDARAPQRAAHRAVRAGRLDRRGWNGTRALRRTRQGRASSPARRAASARTPQSASPIAARTSRCSTSMRADPAAAPRRSGRRRSRSAAT